MADSPLSVPAGGSLTFAVAGVPFTLSVEATSSGDLRVPVSYRPFAATGASEVVLRVGSRERILPFGDRVLCESNLQWRALSAGTGTAFQFHHPPTGLLYCQAVVSADFSRAEILFSEESWRSLDASKARAWELPYPLDQLLFVPALARRGAFLLHACGAAIGGRGFVFAGHSGDGKTTLAGLLSAEGTMLLSDERVAVRDAESGFMAHGTPWPGEGNVVSSASHPVSSMFVLRKAPRHALGPPSSSLAAELLARAIVPYYLPEVAQRILDVFSRLAESVPLRNLHFARSSGLPALLREVA